MEDGALVMGVDIGTTNTKAIVYDPAGRPLAKASAGYPLYTEAPASAEQDAEEIRRAVERAVAEAAAASGRARDIRWLALSAAMHSVLPVDGKGRPLARALTWADSRGQRQAEAIRQNGGHGLYRRTGTPIHPMSPLVKLCWLREARPEVFGRAARFISLKEYVLHRWFGEYVVDHSIASATGLFDLERRTWDAEALAAAGVRPDQLSALVPTTCVLTGMHPDCARAMGLSPDVAVAVGASDGVLANLGVAAIHPGVAAATLGTSGAARLVVDRPLTDPAGRTFCYALTENRWVIGGSTNSAGIVLRWVRDHIGLPPASSEGTAGSGDAAGYDALAECAASVPPGCDGLLFLPFLAGERAPYWNAEARGVYFGLSLQHTRAHLVRAAFEGVLMQLNNVVVTLAELAGPLREVRVGGGVTKSAWWRQTMADVFGIPVAVPADYESSCWGAAALGLFAAGVWDALERVDDTAAIRERIHPDPERTRVYQAEMTRFGRLYETLKGEFTALAGLEGR
ncbi:gluconokinase [Alicyclobacillus macrosporangiidus]|uniref:Gluconokinase n=1 Tax=Alicyclobacillus macrosporangiidus TaxID=392015 RepID=A0A1I7GSY1_9BACL|nr:gluconokinase [Alicyclobacillus macrosporangiidus]SFU51540.1 gluconokinase [Alicyclobacillus macrosporangiidus]